LPPRADIAQQSACLFRANSGPFTTPEEKLSTGPIVDGSIKPRM